MAASVDLTRSAALASAPSQARHGFRPSSRSRVRIAVGTLLSLVAVGVVLLVFSTADKRVAVLQAVHDLPAGVQVTEADFRSIELSTDPSLAVVKASDVASIIGRYTRVRIVSGGLLDTNLLQAAPLVSPGAAVIALTVPSGELPAGLRERSQVQIVIAATGDTEAPTAIVGRVVGVPDKPDAVTGQLSVSLEVAAIDAAAVPSAAKVRVVLLDPGVDPAGTTP